MKLEFILQTQRERECNQLLTTQKRSHNNDIHTTISPLITKEMFLIIPFCFHCRNPNWWRRRTGLERGLTLISIVCSLALVVLVISLVSVIINDKTRDGEWSKRLF